MARSCDFIRGPWTHETRCHVIFSTLWTPLLDKNIPDGVCIVDLSLMQRAFHQIPFQSILVPIPEWLYSTWINGPQNGNFGRTLPKIIPPDSSRNHRGMIKTSLIPRCCQTFPLAKMSFSSKLKKVIPKGTLHELKLVQTINRRGSDTLKTEEVKCYDFKRL